MAITILAPAAPVESNYDYSDSDSDTSSVAGGVRLDDDGDIDMRPKKRARHHTSVNIVTPGEQVTDDPQWMRGHGTFIQPQTTSIQATVAGTLQKTNKLISIRPLRARYTPEIGDLVVARILEVQTKRWKVDVGAPLTAGLALSAINLPNGILRRRTETDELQIRTYFSEGDLLVAEVQSLHQDGAASLHTRSLKYGKLRNGIFFKVAGTGGGGGVVRSRRQVWNFESANGGGQLSVILGVNGYIWISRHVEAAPEENGIGFSKSEELTTSKAYSSQNDEISPETRREISRLRSVIEVLAQEGVGIDEDAVMKGYAAAVEVEAEEMERGGDYLGGERGQRVVSMVLETA